MNRKQACKLAEQIVTDLFGIDRIPGYYETIADDLETHPGDLHAGHIARYVLATVGDLDNVTEDIENMELEGIPDAPKPWTAEERRALSREVAIHLAGIYMMGLTRGTEAQDDDFMLLIEGLADRMIEHAIDHGGGNLDRLEAEISGEISEISPQDIAKLLNASLDHIVGNSPTDVRTAAVEATDHWYDSLDR